MKFLISLIAILVFCGCINTNDSRYNYLSDLTVEGFIQEGQFAEVLLTNSIPFKGRIDSLEVVRAIESKAKVVVSNSETTEILTLKRDDTRFPYLFYRGNIIKGELGETYNLHITISGQEYFSETTIPSPPEVLEVGFVDSFDDENKLEKDLKDLKVILSSADSQVNYFKARFLDVEDEGASYKPAKPFIFNTENITEDSFSVILEYTSLNLEIDEVENNLVLGKSFLLDITSITEEEYAFWKAVKGDETTFLDGVSFNEQIPTNIGGAFGYWSGQNSAKIGLVVK